MVRILITYIIPLLLPTLVYFTWTTWVRKRIAADHAKQPHTPGQADALDITPEEIEAYEIRTPWFRLILMGAVLVIIVLVLSVFLAPKNPPGSVYQPPRVENGKVVPGQFAPKPK